jgi:Zn-dependent protease
VSANAIYLATIWAIPVIIAITFHEAAHGFVAYLLGDDTAWRLGRVSFNPLKHVDPFGTILLPGVLLLLRSPFIFGYAKPVPINFRALRWPRRDMVLGSRLIKSTIQEQRRGRQRPGNFAPACRSGLRCA